MTQAIVSLFSGEGSICLPVNQSNNTIHHLKHNVQLKTNIPVELQILKSKSGHVCLDQQELDLNESVVFFELSGRLLGGKGGFGSMLRAQGGRMNAQKTTNFEACRDLQGRRIRTVNEAKKLQEELDSIPEREAERRERIKQKIEEGLKEREKRKYLFDDNQFLADKEEVLEDVKSAVGDALKRRKLNDKPTTSTSKPAASVSMFDDEDEEEDDEEEEDEEEEEEEDDEEEEKENKPNTKQASKGKGKAKK